MTAADAKPVPVRGQAYRMAIDSVWYSNGGVLGVVTGWTGADTQISLDAAAKGPATNEAVEIGGSAGFGYIDFTALEMTCDCLQGMITFTNLGAFPFPFTLYPAEATDIPVNLTAIEGATSVDGLSILGWARIILAVLAGKLSGAGTSTVVIRAADDSKTRVTATGIDASGNRGATTLDGA